MSKKVIFLDRDNTLNKDPGYISKPEQIELLPYVVEGLQLLKNLGYEFIIITNQSGIARKFFTEKDLYKVNQRLLDILSEYSIQILDIFYCPHKDEDNCNCRKPKPGLIQQALEKYKNIDIQNSWIMGDRLRDIFPGEPFHIKGVLIQNATDELEKELIPKNLITIKENLYQAALFIKEYKSINLRNFI